MLQSFGMLKTAKGFKMQMVKDGNMPGMNRDCDAAFQQGWMEVSVLNGKIVNTWL